MTDYASFRQKLDAVLRTLDVQQVSAFLIAENQWDEGTPADPEYAMWMMIAGSQTMRDQHEQARQWLVNHGHEEEADMMLRKAKGAGSNQGKKNPQKNKTKR